MNFRETPNFKETLERMLGVEGEWKIDFIKSNKEKGYVVIKDGIVKKAVLKEGDVYYKGNLAIERFVEKANEYKLANFIPESEGESIFENKEEEVTLSTNFIMSLLQKTTEAKKQVERINKLVQKVKEKKNLEFTEEKRRESVEIPFGIPQDHVLVFVRNGKVKINRTKLEDEEYEQIVRDFTTRIIEMDKGEGEVLLKGKVGGYYFRYRPGEVVFMLLTKEGWGDLVLSLEG